MAFGDEDIEATFLTDFAVDVVFNGTTVKGIFGQREDTAGASFDLRVQKNVNRILVKTGSLPGVRTDSVVTVDGTGYRVREVTREMDGALTSLTLAPLV